MTMPQAIGHVFLKPHLLKFLQVRENLNASELVLDLRKNTLICRALQMCCQTPDDFGKRYRKALNKKTYSARIRFLPNRCDADRQAYFLDEQGIRDFNDILHNFMVELLNDRISEHVQNPTTDQNAKTAILNFCKEYRLDETDFDWENLKKSEYRLRKVKNE